MIKKLDVFDDLENNCVQIRNNFEHFTLDFDDPEKKEIFFEVIRIYKERKKTSLKDLTKALSHYDEPKVFTIIQDLVEYDLIELTEKQEKSEACDISNVKKNFYILGTGKLFQILKKEYKENYRKFEFFDLKNKIDINRVVSQADFLIVDINEWNPNVVSKINKACLKFDKPWLLIDGVQGNTVKLGPLFIGEDTGCYECLTSRIISNDEFPSLKNSYKNFLETNNLFSKPDISENESQFKLLSNLILLEIDKWEYHSAIPATFKKQVVINLSTLEIDTHTLLKKPYCEVCNSKLNYCTAPFLEPVTLK